MVELQPVDAVEVTLVVDNFVDILLAGAEGVRRFPLLGPIGASTCPAPSNARNSLPLSSA
jgi:hypothetical protein